MILNVTIHSDISSLWPVPCVIVCRSFPVVPKAKITRQLGKAALEIHQEDYHFVDSITSTVFFMFQVI